ncbi:Plasmodium exported protein, unknown function [Plasmodium malariae]|nr:Plasmodium exported protein, unknown function [Plasmodium malariae]
MLNLSNGIHYDPQLNLDVQVVSEEQEDYEEELNELIEQITETWNETFVSMIEDYIDFTEQNDIIDGEWKCQMWNQRWFIYLKLLVRSLGDVLQNDNYSLRAKEHISNEYLQCANNDFIYFLSVVKEEWDRRNAQLNEQVAQA